MAVRRSRAARGDGFGDERRLLFLTALRCGFGVLAACRLVGISNRTAYNLRRDDPDFARDWVLARRMAKLPLELVAFQRGVEGVEEPVHAYGKFSHVQVRRSDRLLIALLAAEDPEKYGRSASARAQGKLAKRIKRVAERLKALEERLEAEKLQSVRNDETVHFVNRPTAAAGRRRGLRRPVASRLDTARRRASAAGISTFPGKS